MKTFARAILYDRDRQGFLVICENSGRPVWDFPGGRTRLLESPLDACKRETRERTSLKITDCRLLFSSVFGEKGELLAGYYYWIDRSTGTLELRKGKSPDHRFLSLDELAESGSAYLAAAVPHLEKRLRADPE